MKMCEVMGPLWTYSLFEYENKNGHIKRLFHGNDGIHHQILDNIDTAVTMQLMHHHISDVADAHRRRMYELGDHCYIIGSSAKTILTDEQRDATKANQEESIVFSAIQRRAYILLY